MFDDLAVRHFRASVGPHGGVVVNFTTAVAPFVRRAHNRNSTIRAHNRKRRLRFALTQEMSSMVTQALLNS
eukprot:gene29798-56035_t